jgi:hypothetical protein
MRNKRLVKRNSKDRFSLQMAEEMIAELRHRIERLEAEVLDDVGSVLPEPAVRRRKGRRPAIEISALLERRNRLATWLEQNWPQLSIALRKAKDSRESIQAMQTAKEHIAGAFQPPFYHHPETFEAQLWSFLESGRFRGNPRNLAGAMAGLPELSWKRSFDICSAHPLKGGQPVQASWDYMRRNFPDRLRELNEVQTPEQVRVVLARSRTNDPVYLHLKEHPNRALEWLQTGKPIQTPSDS